MRCPRCKQDNDRVVDSRASAEGGVIRRAIEGIRADGGHPFNDARHPGHEDAVSAMQKLYQAIHPEG